jgi:manganese transport protein
MNVAVGTSRLSGWIPGLRVAFGPGVLVAVGYMDPGNWATDITAGSHHGYMLLSVVLTASLAAMLLQALSVRLGIASDLDLAQACRRHYPRAVAIILWLFCQIAIVACDMAEIVGTALALNLLFGLPLLIGIGAAAVGTLSILLLERSGRRRLETLIVVMTFLVALCIAIDVVLAHPLLPQMFAGFIPHESLILDHDKLLLSIGIIGATVMPHNLYLHSALVKGSHEQPLSQKRERLKWGVRESCLALGMAFFVNAGILILAAAAFEASGNAVSDIRDAYHLLAPLLGTSAASVLFGVALLAAGQNSTVTATMAGGMIIEGFLGLRVNPWLSRTLTRLAP